MIPAMVGACAVCAGLSVCVVAAVLVASAAAHRNVRYRTEVTADDARIGQWLDEVCS